MKKTYIEPMILIVAVRCTGVIAGSLTGDGVHMKINSTSIEGDADSRQSNSVWDDDEE
jgi:hypothetical protein